jgi:hypothetical protein
LFCSIGGGDGAWWWRQKRDGGGRACYDGSGGIGFFIALKMFVVLQLWCTTVFYLISKLFVMR